MVARRLRIHFNGELLFHLLLIPLCIALSITLFLLLQGEMRNNRLLSQHEAQRAMILLGEAIRRGEDPSQLVAGSALGMGSYNQQGLALHRWGTAPPAIRIDRMGAGRTPWQSPGYFILDRTKRTLVLIDSVGPGRMGSPQGLPPSRPGPYGLPSPFPGPSPPAETFPTYFWAEISAVDYWRRQDALRIGLVMILGFLWSLVFLTLRVLRKRNEYRRRLMEQEQLVRLGRATRTLTHEIRNPLSAIRLRTDILQRLTRPEGDQDLAVIRSEVDRLGRLTDRIGDFLVDSRGKAEVLNLVSFLREKCEHSGVGFNNRVAVPCLVDFDHERLHSVLENLIQNAVESGSPREQVMVVLEATPSRVSVAVRDRGEGIPNELLDKADEPFFSTKPRGFGIGLSVARRFVEAAGGTLRLRRRESGGTEAKIEFQRLGHEDPDR